MRAIVCAAGQGSRLSPLTKPVSKHLLPVYNKPMIYYPISICLLAGFREINLVVNPEDLANYERLFSSLSIEIKFHIQTEPNGIVGAIKTVIGDDESENLFVVLGDNLLFGSDLKKKLNQGIEHLTLTDDTLVFSTPSAQPEKFGVVKYDKDGVAIDIMEKPLDYISNDVVPGLYFINSSHIKHLKKLGVSERGEIEISNFLSILVRNGDLKIQHLGRGMIWIDCGDTDYLADAGMLISLVEKYSGLKIGDINEIIENK